MLVLHTEEALKKEKVKFLSQHWDFINSHLPDSVKNYVFHLLMSQDSGDFSLSDNDMQDISNLDCDKVLLYCVLYVCYRKIDYQWVGLFKYIKRQFNTSVDFNVSFDYEADQNAVLPIRQCRPDKTYTYEEIQNIGFYNKNQNALYSCHNDQEAQLYIRKELGLTALKAYNNLQSAQAKSDFFLISSLYVEGGVSADVCSVAQADISVLIKDSDLCLVYDEQGFQKKFISTFKHNKFIEYYLSNLIKKSCEGNGDFDYRQFSDRFEFHKDFMDFFAFRYDYIQKLKINYISEKIYNVFVRAEFLEENLHVDTHALPFAKVALKGLFKKNFISQQYEDNFSIAMTKNFYMPPSNNITIIGANKSLNLSQHNRTPYSLPSLDVWGVEGAYLSGNGAVWYNDKFLDLEAYLNHVLLHETYGGFWKKPEHDNITNVISEECIIAFSPGHGCYGHYIVDDLPRLGLIKDYLGDRISEVKVIISDETPEWAKGLLRFFLGIRDENFLVFDHNQDVWKLERVLLSSYPHKGYHFHSYIKKFYTNFSKKDVKPFRKICLSRKKWEKNKVHQRIFESQDMFEELALSKGFELINPETLSLREQIDIMSETACQIGEHGSAQHASVYNYYGNTIVGTINPLTEVQSALGRLYGDKNIICYANSSRNDELHNTYFDVSREVLLQFFERIEDECRRAGI